MLAIAIKIASKAKRKRSMNRSFLVMCRRKLPDIVMCCAMTLVILLSTKPSARAYERDVHYELTKFLALSAGFSENEAERIAAANQELDTRVELGALPADWQSWKVWRVCPGLLDEVMSGRAFKLRDARHNCPELQRMLQAQRAYHFVDGARLESLRDSAFRSENLKVLGHYLHALQDTFSHSLMNSSEMPLLRRLEAGLGVPSDEEIIGHLMYGHSVDETHNRPNLAETMARDVYMELSRFKGSENRWTEIEDSVAGFVREQDPERKSAYLTPTPTKTNTEQVEIAKETSKESDIRKLWEQFRREIKEIERDWYQKHRKLLTQRKEQIKRLNERVKLTVKKLWEKYRELYMKLRDKGSSDHLSSFRKTQDKVQDTHERASQERRELISRFQKESHELWMNMKKKRADLYEKTVRKQQEISSGSRSEAD